MHFKCLQLQSMEDDIDFMRDSNDAADTTLEVHPSTSNQNHTSNASSLFLHKTHPQDATLVDNIVRDNRNSPSTYKSSNYVISNIPGKSSNKKTRPVLADTRTMHVDQYTMQNAGATMPVTSQQLVMIRSQTTPSSKDLLDKQSHYFTEEKPFQPRTLKTTSKSKLSQFKYYNPPKRLVNMTTSNTLQSTTEPATTNINTKSGSTSRGGLRPQTPMTDSVELMSETLVSRDMGHATPTGVPPLDISLDKDHLMWLKEQSKKAHIRSTYRTRSDLVSDVGSAQGLGTNRRLSLTSKATLEMHNNGQFHNGGHLQTANLAHTSHIPSQMQTGTYYPNTANLNSR